MNKKLNSGFTLTELMVTVAIVGIVSSIAMPSFVDMIKNARLKTAAESIYTDLQYTKMQSVKQNTVVSLVFSKTSNSNWCYGITDKADCDCTKALADAASCSITENGAAILKVTSSSELSDMQLTSAEDGFSFNPVRSTVSSGGVTLYNDTNYVRVKTSGLGKVSYCIPSGNSWGGYYSC